MKIRQLSILDRLYVDPFWLRSVQAGHHDVTLEDDQIITLKGERMRLKEPDPALATGTELEVWLNGYGFFVCATKADIAEDKAKQEREAEIAKENKRLAANKIRDKAIAVNSAIKLPVKWTVGIKLVLSGLSESSWGDGRNARSVHHILLQGDLKAGRLVRHHGDFLCTAASGSNGLLGSSERNEETATDGDGAKYLPEVTCKACLARAQALMSKGV